jgi:hypothetical protein
VHLIAFLCEQMGTVDRGSCSKNRVIYNLEQYYVGFCGFDTEGVKLIVDCGIETLA